MQGVETIQQAGSEDLGQGVEFARNMQRLPVHSYRQSSDKPQEAFD
jgi:hypothetical protein